MNEPSFASLSPTLLARKGGARPAMRPQHGGMLAGAAMSADAANSHDPHHHGHHDHDPDGLDDLGWNDMGDEPETQRDADIVRLTPEPANEETAAEARELDEVSQARLAAAARAKSTVLDQQKSLVERLDLSAMDVADTPAEEPAPPAPVATAKKPAPVRSRRSAIDRGKRAAFTLRLDAERHLKLRLACTIRGRSAQQIVTDALDALMGDMPELESLAAQVKRR